ncbi:carnitinyl-CoA dehydratase [Amycolatopsis deserti]|uniref:Carnitinyl-CoA dehydratase n=1 Tax=Amycolatopsis deserti TaxID=185696 RepID=A0ABQ3JCA2_9PSEU|nr:enoyl-CoA hydratase-related protein [Amycolatopsis deserti]GHF18690.1 carnitinyl-CoA dehydratase [Amycolatopsis deserti]
MAIDTDQVDDILVVRLNRPEAYNALDPDAMVSLRETLIGFRDNPELSVAVITGAGDRAFCTGADLKRTKAPAGPFAAAHLAPYEIGVRDGGYVRAITISELAIPKPLIAAINGHALGGGLEIALDCDLRVASPNATFGLPEARWASVPAVGGASHLLRAVPPAVAMKMLLTGDRIDAVEAHRVGLVSDVVAADQLMDTALGLARRITANGPLAVRAIKSLALRTHDLPLSRSIELEQLLWGLLRDTDDRAEGRQAFADRRDPRYHGA